MLKTGCLLSLCLLACGSVSAAVPSVKVLIAKSLKRITVEGIDLTKTVHLRRQTQQYQGRKTLSFNCTPRSPRHKAMLPKNPLLVASLSSPTGLVTWGKSRYQGELQLLANPEKESCDLVNNIPLEAYITTLLSKEMNGTWPVEALKAQAVAARTYALERVKKEGTLATDKLFHLESSEKDQVSGSFNDVTKLTLQASRETSGEILVGPSGRMAPVFFHAKCGGKTLRPDQVWGGVEEGYRSVNCTFCQKTGRKDWDVRLRNGKITQMVDQVLRRYYADELQSSELRLMPDSEENSELRLYAGDRLHIVKKSYLRNLAGREVLPSNNFVINQTSGGIEVKGRGYGHGVGLCQLGALELAKRGYDYRQILSFYFPRHRMKKVY